MSLKFVFKIKVRYNITIMKTLFYIISSIFLFLILFGAGCMGNDTYQTSLNGKWTLTGFGDDSTGNFISEPQSEPRSSYIIFDNGKLDAFSVTNRTFNVSYTVKDETKISINPGIITLVGGDTEWGQKFLLSLNGIYKFNKIDNDLILYYDNQKFMKLKK
jgi:hypothetical protein